MITKTLQNGTRIITEKNTVNEISENRIRQYDTNNSLYNQINSQINQESNTNNLVNELQDSERLTAEQMAITISETRNRKVPKKVDLI